MSTPLRGTVGDYMTLEEAAKAKGGTRWGVYAYVRRNKVPTRRIGNTLMVRLIDLEGYIPR